MLQEALAFFNTDKHQWYGWKDLSAGEVYSNLKLNDETAVMPTEEEVNQKIAELTVPDWLRNRLEHYPSIQDCIHALLDGGETLTDLQAARQVIKDTYPKP